MADCNVVVLISGSGSNLQALIDSIAQDGNPARIAAALHRAACASSTERRVPAPTMASGTAADISRMHCSATGVRSVISSTFTPPATSARASGTASATRCSTITGITGPWATRSSVFIGFTSRSRRPLRR